MVEVIRAFCWHQKFVPKGFSAFAPGLYTCIKSLQMCIKLDFKEIILKLFILQVVETPIQTSSPVPPVSAEPSEEKTDDGDEYGYTLGKSVDIRH